MDLPLFIFIGALDDSSDTEFPIQVYQEDSENGVRGLVVLSQTCDVVRSIRDRPYVEVCPLVDRPANMQANSTQYTTVPGARHLNLVADLDRVMAVKKDLLVQLQHQEGCSSDEERRQFAIMLERKRGRFAFPDDFSRAMSNPLSDIRRRHANPNSEVGKVYRTIEEIRVRAAPDWNADNVIITLYFIVKPNADRAKISNQVEKLIEKIKLPKRYNFSDPKYQMVALDDLTAREYVGSNTFDLEYISFG